MKIDNNIKKVEEIERNNILAHVPLNGSNPQSLEHVYRLKKYKQSFKELDETNITVRKINYENAIHKFITGEII